MLLYFCAPADRSDADQQMDGLRVLTTMREEMKIPLNGPAVILHHLVVRHFLRRPLYTYVIMSAGRCLHCSTIMGRTFRFPFMAKDDICIASSWTAPTSRGQGLFTAILRQVLHDFRSRRVWIFANHANAASLCGIRKAGLPAAGEGRLRKPLGMRLFGRYIVYESPRAGC